MMICINNNPSFTGNTFTSVQKFIIEKFSNNTELNNSVIVVGYNEGMSFQEVKTKYPNKKIIIYVSSHW